MRQGSERAKECLEPAQQRQKAYTRCGCHKLEAGQPPIGHAHVTMHPWAVLGSAHCTPCVACVHQLPAGFPMGCILNMLLSVTIMFRQLTSPPLMHFLPNMNLVAFCFAVQNLSLFASLKHLKLSSKVCLQTWPCCSRAPTL